MDKLIRGTAKNGMIRVMAADTRELVGEASRIHGCTPTAAAALGRGTRRCRLLHPPPPNIAIHRSLLPAKLR